MVPSGSPDRCAAPPPEKLTAVATAFHRRAFHYRGVTLRILRQTVQQGIQLGNNIAHHETHLQNNLPRSPCHFQYIPASLWIYLSTFCSSPGSGRTLHQRLQAIAQRGEIYPRPIALNDTPLLQALHPLGGARRGQPHSRAQDLEAKLWHPESGRGGSPCQFHQVRHSYISPNYKRHFPLLP